jgi:hypothetical protein
MNHHFAVTLHLALTILDQFFGVSLCHVFSPSIRATVPGDRRPTVRVAIMREAKCSQANPNLAPAFGEPTHLTYVSCVDTQLHWVIFLPQIQNILLTSSPLKIPSVLFFNLHPYSTLLAFRISHFYSPCSSGNSCIILLASAVSQFEYWSPSQP